MSSVSRRTPCASATGRAFSGACSTRRHLVSSGRSFCAARSTSTFSTARNATAACESSRRLWTCATPAASWSASGFHPTPRKPRAPVIRPTSTTSTTRPPSQRRPRKRPPRPPCALRPGHPGRRFQCQRNSHKGAHRQLRPAAASPSETASFSFSPASRRRPRTRSSNMRPTSPRERPPSRGAQSDRASRDCNTNKRPRDSHPRRRTQRAR
ncbi:MAG: hypothetical protein JWP87_4622 [Labilithrix sp.]|nr:hypothetical protein [Labilithrix sp.]